MSETTNEPYGITVDATGANLYVSDEGCNTITQINLSASTATTLSFAGAFTGHAVSGVQSIVWGSVNSGTLFVATNNCSTSGILLSAAMWHST